MWVQPSITTEETVQDWLAAANLGGLPAAIVTAAYQAAEAYVGKRCRWAIPPVDETAVWVWPPAPDDLVLAVCMQTARLLARRQSVDGFVGMGEFGPARVTVTDRDVSALMDPYRVVTFG